MEGLVLLSISMDIQQQNSFSAIYNTIEIIVSSWNGTKNSLAIFL